MNAAVNSSSPRLALLLRWLARATSLLSIGVLLLFLTGKDGVLGGNVRPAEWLGLLFFPFGVMLGLALAWWREALGAAVAAGSLTAFYLSQALLAGRLPGGPWFLIFTSPAALFFASWFAHRGGSVRYVQNLLLVLGAAALGASAFGLGVCVCLAATESHARGFSGVAAAGLAILFLVGGAALGALVGLVAAALWIIKHDSQLWKPRIWGGAALGIVVGLALPFASSIPGSPELVGILEYWPVAAVVTAALGMLGGVVATFAGSFWDRHDGDPRRERNQWP
jgi:hypothetical protein